VHRGMRHNAACCSTAVSIDTTCRTGNSRSRQIRQVVQSDRGSRGRLRGRRWQSRRAL
jgi:hypothetical protein